MADEAFNEAAIDLAVAFAQESNHNEIQNYVLSKNQKKKKKHENRRMLTRKATSHI